MTIRRRRLQAKPTCFGKVTVWTTPMTALFFIKGDEVIQQSDMVVRSAQFKSTCTYGDHGRALSCNLGTSTDKVQAVEGGCRPEMHLITVFEHTFSDRDLKAVGVQYTV